MDSNYDFEELLKRARERMPKIVFSGRKRFQMPTVVSFIQGSKTIITNINSICSYLNRNVKHLVKFLAKELAAPFVIEGSRVIFTGVFSNAALNERLKIYVETYVKCKECNSYDTELVKEGKFYFLHCLACGAKYPVKPIK